LKHIGIFFTGTHLRAAVLEEGLQHTESVQEFEYQFADSGRSCTELIESVLNEYKDQTFRLYSALPRHEAYVRILTLPSGEKSEIKTMAGYDLADLLPLNPEQFVFDTLVLKTGEDGYSSVMLAAADRTLLRKNLDFFVSASFIPSAFCLSSAVLCSQVSLLSLSAEPLLSVHCEDNYLEFNLLKEGICIFSRGLALNIEAVWDTVSEEIKKSLVSASLQGIDQPRILVSGRGIDREKWKNDLSRELGCSVETDPYISVARGLALAGQSSGLSPDLLPLSYTRAKRAELKKRNLLITAALVVFNVFLAANIFMVKIRQRQSFIPVLMTEMQKIEKPAMMLQDKMRKARLAESYFYSGKYVLGLMSELYRLAPEEMTFRSLDISGRPSSGTVLITGSSSRADQVFTFSARIKQSALFFPDVENEYKKVNGADTEQVEFTVKAKF